MSIVYVPQTITEETMFPPCTPFFLKAWRTSRFPTPLPAHGREARP